MKNNKPKKASKTNLFEEHENNKKKLTHNSEKINLKSHKFWSEIYDEEGEDIEKFIR